MVTPTKTKTDIEKLLEKFNQWADERIIDIRNKPPIDRILQTILSDRIEMLNWAKRNLERLAREILDDKNKG